MQTNGSLWQNHCHHQPLHCLLVSLNGRNFFRKTKPGLGHLVSNALLKVTCAAFKRRKGPRFQDLVQSFLSSLHDKQIIIYSSKCFCHFTLCWMLFAARFNSICFINFRRASKKRCEKKGFNGKAMHPSLEKSSLFPEKVPFRRKKNCTDVLFLVTGAYRRVSSWNL